MIRGTVTPLNEALIKIRFRAASGLDITHEAVLDTGFTDYLTLRPQDAARLATQFDHSRQYTLADGSMSDLDLHRVEVYWDGQWLTVLGTIVDVDPLLGMALLRGFRLSMDIVDGGPVSIEPLP